MRQSEIASMKNILQNSDMDNFDMYQYQPLFIEETDEFYGTTPPMPSDDIWKKFELLPTPPRSPAREEGNLDFEDILPLDIAELLRDEESLSTKILTFPDAPPSPNLQSKLIQDCMWSGGRNGIADVGDEKQKKDKTLLSGNAFDLNSTDCVDPAAVFPYPISNIAETRLHSLGTETPSDSEEEIDVVTVEKKQKRVTTLTVTTRRKPVPTVLIKTEPVSSPEPDVKTEPLDNSRVDTPTDVHNYSLSHSQSYKRLRSLPNATRDTSSSSPTKRLKREISMPELKRAVQKLHHHKSSSNSSCSSRNSSDSEEGGEGKRTQHNVLERKRRDDLKSSFFKLRDSVPELCKQERAPKVMILRRATDFILKLTDDNDRLVSEQELLKEKHEQLRRTLGRLLK